jgi:hypothetical protein
MQALVNKYAHVEGSYESTMLGGIVHGYCDSGILTDSYSVEDAELVAKYFTQEAQDSGYLELFNNFIVEVSGGEEELLCCKVIDEMCAICRGRRVSGCLHRQANKHNYGTLLC